ncbi:PREDICTED: TGF-beta-activated kinase 1 and MAP3K7-binding protein 1-like isoform X2 [Ceratosolen solmsi marchali]|uniref:TGF-beta-activated kinase 1 and MAP3K7-binding protein 1 n=1 Tax=Ceratosolen solmsi marchali TaxID=326594 RepID=A0AAJ6YVL6_9HYME|nr:PREDICTED: TGF-beta-activated kinase 1 and MAP3K7-binding protein 1-like isoform X2 [Ceratosolen solmsi marchali]
MNSGAEQSNFFQDTQQSWTDDLPVCKQSGVGFSTNQIYREDGYRQKEHSFEDRSFHFKYDDSTFLYAVFNGHEGTKAVTFAMQRMTAEILLGQLNDKTTDEEVKEVLRQAFISVERGYNDSIGDLLAERTSLQCDIPDGLNSYEAYQKFPDVVNKLNTLNCELSAGTSAIVVLIYRGKLYVANVGDGRALLCKTDSNQVLRVVQLSADHDLKNEDEILRLCQLGLDIKSIRQGSHLGNQENTRCLGNYLVKGGYKEFEELSSASSEPIIAEPEIHAGIELDQSCRFLLLMSRGVYKSLEEATGTDQVNKELALLAVEQFRVQSTLTGVAQAVVDKIVRIHHDVNMSNSQNTLTNGKRDDITLLVRNFNFPMPNALKSPTIASMHFNPQITNTESYCVSENNSNCGTSKQEVTSISDETSTETCDTTKLADKRNARIKPHHF